jgi:hypothetical protein
MLIGDSLLTDYTCPDGGPSLTALISQSYVGKLDVQVRAFYGAHSYLTNEVY